MKWMHTSSACSTKLCTLSIAFGLLSTKTMMTSRADLRAEPSACDFATPTITGRRWLTTWFLKKSAVSVVHCNAWSTSFRYLGSPAAASWAITPLTSGMSGARGFRSSRDSIWSTKLQSREAAMARTPSTGSARHVRRTWKVWSGLAIRICHTEHAISFTTKMQSMRTPVSLLGSMIVRMSVGISSGHSTAFFGRWSSKIWMIWFAMWWMQSATFRRTGGRGSASSICSRVERSSAWPASPSCAQMESPSLALLRHCRSSTAACSRAGCSTCPSRTTWKSATTVCAGC
mmetsp:Transcript_5126/g.13890  ORF Transcript_5126/g.13890 Transcript_5126/m.13890 type:complete len:288 (-) Transcript_5126:137-1000(-)